MKFIPTQLPGVVIIETQVFDDSRGFFMETWHATKFASGGIAATFVQDNQSRSFRGILRGLHLQVAHGQGKLVRVVRGRIFDVAADVRKNSRHFGKWIGHILTEDNRQQLWIPPGFAHGFYVLSEIADVLYKCTEFYEPHDEVTLRWDDHDLDIRWPLINGETPTVSTKDAEGLTLQELKARLP